MTKKIRKKIIVRKHKRRDSEVESHEREITKKMASSGSKNKSPLESSSKVIGEIVLTPYEQKISRVLAKSFSALTTSEISEMTGFSWLTTKQSLDSLVKKAPVKKETHKNRIYWSIED